MVKRPKSPEVADDARYFTVYMPYPLNPNWFDEDDQKACAMWVAECIGPNHLWAIHEKPKARNMILLEVSKDFEDHGSLLGEHKWSEFLKDPTNEEKSRVTQVFHSFYARGRDAQKDGWKVVVVNSKWFYGFSPGKDRIVHPYPNTHWCPTPVEDKTNKPLCRPLPSEQKAPPPKPLPIVVGSSTWVAKQNETAPTRAALTSAWSRGSASEREQTKSTTSSPSIQPNSPLSSAGSIPASPSAPKGKIAWGRAVPLQKFVADAVRSNANAKKPGWATKPSAALVGANSPLAEEPPKGPVNAWSKPLKVPEAQRSKPPPPPTFNIESAWSETFQSDPSAWFVEEPIKNDITSNSNEANAGSSSKGWGAPPSPRKDRKKDWSERRDDRPSTRKGRDTTRESDRPRIYSSRRESTSKPRSERSDRDKRDPPREKPRAWDMPSPEQSTKHMPKPWDKKKREKETIETMFGPVKSDDTSGPGLSASTTEDNTMDVGTIDWGEWGPPPPKSPARDKGRDWGEWGPPPSEKPARDEEREWGEWGPPPPKSSSRDDELRDKGLSHRNASPSKRKDRKPVPDDDAVRRPRYYGEPLVLMEDLAPGRSAGQWDHTGYNEFKPHMGSSRKKSGGGRGGPRDGPPWKGFGGGKKSGPRSDPMDDYQDFGSGSGSNAAGAYADWQAKPIDDWGIDPTDATAGSGSNTDWQAKPIDDWGADPTDAITGSGSNEDWQAKPIDNRGVDPTTISATKPGGEWGPDSTATIQPVEEEMFEPSKWEDGRPDDFDDWGHAPHKTKKMAAKKGRNAGLDHGAGSASGSRDASVGSSAKARRKNKEQESGEADTFDDLAPYESESTTDHGSKSKKAHVDKNWGSWSVPAPKDSTSDKTVRSSNMIDDQPISAPTADADQGPSTELHSEKSKDKDKARPRDDFGSRPEDWGLPADTPMKKTISDHEFGTRPEDWGLPPDESMAAPKGTKSDHVFGSRPEDWGLPPAESKSAPKGPEADHVFGLRAEDWGLPPQEFKTPSTNNWNVPPEEFKADVVDQSLLHPWEVNAVQDLNIWGPEPSTTDQGAPDSPPRENQLRCPTHNYNCKKSICRDMARLVKEEELRSHKADDSNRGDWGNLQGSGGNNRGPYNRRGPSKRRRRRKDPNAPPRKEPSNIGRLRAFADIDERERDEEEMEVDDANVKSGSSPMEDMNSWGGEAVQPNLADWGVL